MELTIKVVIKSKERLYQLLDILKNTELNVDYYKLTKEDYINIICSYYTISFEDLLLHKDSKEDKYVYPKKFICFFLNKELNLKGRELSEILGYSKTSNTARINITYIEAMLQNNDERYVRPYNNLTELFNRFNPNVKDILL